MPRIKPPRAQAVAETLPEIEHFVPIEGPVEIELPEYDLGPTEIDVTTREPPPASPKPEPAASPAPAEVEVDPLQRALDAQKHAEELQRATARERDDANRRAQDHQRELEQERSGREDAEYNSILTAIAAEQAALDKAEADQAGFSSIGDWAAAAKAQRVIGTASARLDRLEDNKLSFEQRRENKTTPQPARTDAPLDFEQRISAMPEDARGWLRKHPEFITDTEKTRKIGAAHNYLVEVQGKAAFSPEYFDAIEEQFGLKTPAPAPAAAPEPQPQRRSMPVSAPVSRDVPTPSGQRQSSSKITLTEEQRQIARTSFTATDMTEAQKEYLYAQNLRKLQTKRANGEYPTREQG